MLAAYGFGLFAIVLIRSAIASFQSQGDTRTPMMISLSAVAVNVLLKLALFQPFGAPGLAIATAVGAWINFGLLVALAVRSGAMRPDMMLGRVAAATGISAVLLAGLAIFGQGPAARVAASVGDLATVAQLLVMALSGAVLYGLAMAVLLRLFGVRLARLKPLRRPAATPDGE